MVAKDDMHHLSEPLLQKSPNDEDLRPSKRLPKNNFCLGSLLMLFASICSTAMKFLVKYLYVETVMNSFEVGYWRAFIALLINIMYIYCHGINFFSIPRNNVKYLLVRGFTGFVGLACAFTALRLLTISQATVIFFTNPFFTTFLAFVILKERLVLCDVLAMICGLIGIFFMFSPSFIFGSYKIDPLLSKSLFHNGEYQYLGIGLGLLGAFCAGIAYTSSRKVLSKTHFTIPSVLFSVFSTILMPVLSSTERSFNPPRAEAIQSPANVIILTCIGVLGFAVQMFLSLALKFERTGRSTVIWYTQILFIYILDIAYF